ncbi:MAG: GTPase ObgE [Verrucomicrobia bacterium]|nr:GTPase ObgE [Verrucomicrobiota bacterium]
MKTRTFMDSVVLYVQAGDGGNGCCSFRRERSVAKGGPDGGDGGRGGNIILVGCRNENSLVRLYFTPHQKAPNGGHGKGKQLYGRNGEDLYIPVPCGTEVRDRASGALLGDITENDEKFMLAKGGKGGLGNVHWKSSTHQTPMEQTDGEAGQVAEIILELKLLADVGLVGFPNAGKSSILAKISDAHPKIGAYPFTTLNPIIGTIIFDDFSHITLADIPGLIEGANEGIGLGHDFLRHIERSKCLVYVIDMSGLEGRKPHDDYRALRKELELYQVDLIDRPCFVVANKMDVEESQDNLEEFKRETGLDPLRVSASDGSGISELRSQIYNMIREQKRAIDAAENESAPASPADV